MDPITLENNNNRRNQMSQTETHKLPQTTIFISPFATFPLLLSPLLPRLFFSYHSKHTTTSTATETLRAEPNMTKSSSGSSCTARRVPRFRKRMCAHGHDRPSRGLHFIDVVLPSRQIEFNVVRNKDWSQVFYPGAGETVVGPDSYFDVNDMWCLAGAPNETFRIEFKRIIDEALTEVTWTVRISVCILGDFCRQIGPGPCTAYRVVQNDMLIRHFADVMVPLFFFCGAPRHPVMVPRLCCE